MRSFRNDPALWMDDAKAICLKEKIPFTNFKPYTDGSNLVASIDDRYVLKIFPPFLRHQWDSEYKTLQHLHNKLTVPIPELLFTGEYDGWTYVIITKLVGESLEKVWSGFDHQTKSTVMRRIGGLMKEVHSLPLESVNIEPKWNDFIPAQLSCYKARHQTQGMPEWFMQDVEDFINLHYHLLPFDPEEV